jgi:hypothetical protein
MPPGNPDLIAVVDRQAEIALDRDRPFHRHRRLREQKDGDGLIGANNSWPTPEKLPVSC